MKAQLSLEDLIAIVIGLALFIPLYGVMSPIITAVTDPTIGGLLALVPTALVIWMILNIFKKALGRSPDERFG